MKKSTPIIKEIKDYFKKLGYQCERINAGKLPIGRGGWIQLATPGHPDMIAYLPHRTTLFIEIKVEGDFLSEDQENYIAYLKKCEYDVITAATLEDVQKWLFQNGFAQASSLT